MEVTLGLAFLAGLASFLSPCVFALVPAYVGYLGGRTISYATGDGTVQTQNKWMTFSHGLAFVLGFTLIFVFLGVAAAALGAVLFDIREWLTRIGGIVVLIFGLHMTGIIHIGFLEYDLRPENTPDRSRGYLSSMMMGVFFSAGWSPCVGPVLGAILTLVLNGLPVVQGATLLTAYSIGLGIPFLIASFGVDWVTTILRKYGRVLDITYKGMGVVLILLGILLFSGQLEAILAPYTDFFFIDFGL